MTIKTQRGMSPTKPVRFRVSICNDLLDGKDVKYSAEINTQASPLLNFLLTGSCR